MEAAFPDGPRLLTVSFDLDSSTLSPASAQTLRRMAKALRAVPERRIEVNGFTDDLGSDAYNHALSLRRAKAVAGVLEASGVSSSRMDVQGLSSAQPVCSGGGDVERAANRRADIRLLP